jgi:hypothetical protein
MTSGKFDPATASLAELVAWMKTRRAKMERIDANVARVMADPWSYDPTWRLYEPDEDEWWDEADDWPPEDEDTGGGDG